MRRKEIECTGTLEFYLHVGKLIRQAKIESELCMFSSSHLFGASCSCGLRSVFPSVLLELRL